MDEDTTQCAHTEVLQNSWWRIDLMGVNNISYISIYNRGQSNANQQNGRSNTDITGAQIHIGNSRENNGTNNSM